MTEAARRTTTLAESVTIATWSKNHRSHEVRVCLRSYNGQNLVDIRTWFAGNDGTLLPGKGFVCNVKGLPRLADVIAKAVSKAIELGLIDGDEPADG